jgi:hypothetical protein
VSNKDYLGKISFFFCFFLCLEIRNIENIFWFFLIYIEVNNAQVNKHIALNLQYAPLGVNTLEK